jgi:hypothetical protein
MAPIDGDGVHAARARERRPAGAEHGRATPGVDRPAGGRPGAQPAVRLRRQLRPPPRAWLRGADEPLHARAVLPLRRGAAQLRAERDLAGGHVRRREGFLGISANWDRWVHLFRAELHTLSTLDPRVHRVVRAGGMSISLRESHRELYIPCTMTSNNAEWERGWFYLRNDKPDLPPTLARF